MAVNNTNPDPPYTDSTPGVPTSDTIPPTEEAPQGPPTSTTNASASPNDPEAPPPKHHTSHHRPLLHLWHEARLRPVPSSSLLAHPRNSAQRVLASKQAHYTIIALVVVDVLAVFGELVAELFILEGGEGETAQWELLKDALGLTGNIVSCLFVVELALSLMGFGMR